MSLLLLVSGFPFASQCLLFMFLVCLFRRKCVKHHTAVIHCLGLLVFGCCDRDIGHDQFLK
jgi:hypothetical protein